MWFNVSAYCPEKGYFVALFEDITERKRSERELLRQRTIGNVRSIAFPISSPLSIISTRLCTRNKAMAQRLGVTPEKAIGLDCFTCVHGDTAPPEFCPHSKSIKDGKEHIAEVHEPHLGGDFLVSTTPLFDEKGCIVGSVHVARNITDRKKAEEEIKRVNEELEEMVLKRTEEIYGERHRLYSILEALLVYVILLDKNYCVPFANKVFRERFGESHGRRCHEFLFKRELPCENCESYKVLKNNGPHHWEWTGPDGRDYDIYDFPFVEADGSTLILEMGIDITERKRAEKQIRDVSLYSRSLHRSKFGPSGHHQC